MTTGDVVMEVEKVESLDFGLPFMPLRSFPFTIRPCRTSLDCWLLVTSLTVDIVDGIPSIPLWSMCVSGYPFLSRSLGKGESSFVSQTQRIRIHIQYSHIGITTQYSYIAHLIFSNL